MAKIFVSFLGTGSPAKKPIGYDAAAYNWPGKSDLAVTVCFAQTAILKILEEKAVVDGPVNKAIFLCTKESKEKHLHALQEELREHLVASVDCVVPEPLVPTDMSPEHQWGWFEQLLGLVGQGDTLIIDFTHGPSRCS
jgi:CRISPR-associated protein (cas_TM1812).